MSILFSGRATGATAKKISLMQRWWMSWTHHLRQAIGSLGELWRTPLASLMTIAVLGVSLTLPTTLHLLVKNVQSISGSFTQAAEISFFIKDDATEAQITTLRTMLSADPEIEQVHFISKQQAMEEFSQLSGFGQAMQHVADNPLPNVLLVLPRNTQPQAAETLRARIEQERIVEFGKLDIAWLERLDAMLLLLRQAVLAIAVLLLSAVLLIIGNTIRLSIMNKKEEIEVMKLVGATDAFIQRPFLYTGVWFGLFGGCLAFLIVELMLWWLEAAIGHITELYHSHFTLMAMSLSEFMALIGIAVALGLAGSYLSVSRHIRAIEPTGP
ncbi:permease-like cell division protein FtsX [Alkalimonas collagenimarina]|uniref:Cell division protein FtsX n=1 Tax=Alkalimonas collagenimarina TaxID=400390 RepID=A0ABT9GVJ3_9GAMM|nr:permease-like cell division protein FtsX [Alkalimonas collagenimarina]MDP4535072.1 permease-like cell division protein FtsX [Alkalimonas collagenimarina]